MDYIKKHRVVIFEILFFTLIFFLSILPLRDYDIWFHVKSGEIIAKLGIIHYDVFSYTAAGREWFPYEWLYQIAMYWVQEAFGFEAIKYATAAAISTMVWLVYSILKKIFSLNPLISAAVSFFFLVSLYEFMSSRPHAFAYTFLLSALYIIFLYFFKNKNYLWITLPITLVWANMHGSIFLDIYLFGAYAFLSFVNYFIFKEKEWMKKGKTLSIYTIITAVLTVLPPLGILQYRLLWNFFRDNAFISQFIEEWTPLRENPFSFLFFSGTVIIIFGIFLITVWKKKNWIHMLWVLPLLPFPALAYAASRNVFLGYITLTLILGWSIAQFNFKKHGKPVRILLLSIIVIFLGLHIFILKDKRFQQRLYYPVNAVKFIKQNHFKGNMFNEYGYGGYLLYHLYPEQKVFFDGRTDVYLCCEMRATMTLAKNKHLPDKEYKKVLDKFWNKYRISYFLFRTEKHSSLRKIGRVLTDDPDWRLVFWDDDSLLFMRNDGKNPQIMKNFAVEYATPYNQNPYRKGREKEALAEYQKMIKVADSAKSRNAIGYIYLQEGKYDEAEQEFNRALELDRTNESPYMNLAELAAKDNNLDEAITLYKQALSWAPDRGLIYIRLGQLTLQSTGNLEAARTIWQEGLQKTVDSEAKDKLKKLLEQ